MKIANPRQNQSQKDRDAFVNDGIDIVKIAKGLPQRSRGNSCIVLTHKHEEQRAWAEELAVQTGAHHLDLLDHFVSHPDLAENIGQFTIQNLFDLLSSIRNQKVLIVTGLEFLLATWTGIPNAMEQFANQIEYWDKSPALLIVMQYDSALAARRFTRYPQYKFVVDQKETFALL